MGWSILENGGLSMKYVSPCSASCVLFLAPAGVVVCVQGNRRLCGKRLARMGHNWCHQMPVIAGKVYWLGDIKNLIEIHINQRVDASSWF